MLVKMNVRVAQITVNMPVDVKVGSAAERSSKRRHPESDDHQGNTEFQPACDTLWNRDFERDYNRTDDHERCRVSRSPQQTDDRRTPEFLLLADNYRDSHNVVNFGGVLEPIDK